MEFNSKLDKLGNEPKKVEIGELGLSEEENKALETQIEKSISQLERRERIKNISALALLGIEGAIGAWKILKRKREKRAKTK